MFDVFWLCFCVLYVLSVSILLFILFFFNDTATTEIYTLSLHDALPIFRCFLLTVSSVCSNCSSWLIYVNQNFPVSVPYLDWLCTYARQSAWHHYQRQLEFPYKENYNLSPATSSSSQLLGCVSDTQSLHVFMSCLLTTQSQQSATVM